MEQTLALAPRWAVLMDPAAAQSVIERVSMLQLPRRICRPLDCRSEQNANAELVQFDATVDATAEAETAGDELPSDTESPRSVE